MRPEEFIKENNLILIVTSFGKIVIAKNLSKEGSDPFVDGLKIKDPVIMNINFKESLKGTIELSPYCFPDMLKLEYKDSCIFTLQPSQIVQTELTINQIDNRLIEHYERLINPPVPVEPPTKVEKPTKNFFSVIVIGIEIIIGLIVTICCIASIYYMMLFVMRQIMPI